APVDGLPDLRPLRIAADKILADDPCMASEIIIAPIPFRSVASAVCAIGRKDGQDIALKAKRRIYRSAAATAARTASCAACSAAGAGAGARVLRLHVGAGVLAGNRNYGGYRQDQYSVDNCFHVRSY